MKHVIIRRPGGYERLELVTSPDPSPGPGEVVVKTASIGVNYADCVVRMGLYSSAKRYVGWPITPGFEASGTIVAVGEGVTELAVGDAVLAVSRFGAYTTHLRVPVSWVRRVPSQLSLLQAGAFPTVHLTAWYALTECAHLRKGARVLIHSAAGGVGSAAVQLAKARGAQVTGVVGNTHKVERVLELGADFVIDKRREALWERARGIAPDGWDVVLDPNGTETLAQSYRHLAPTGRLVVYGAHTMLPRGGSGRPNLLKLAWDYFRMPRFNPLSMVDRCRGVVGFNLSYLFDRTELFVEGFDELDGLLAAGRLSPPQVTSYPLDQVAEAHRALESGETVGKLTLVP